jgi:hypothetical protein
MIRARPSGLRRRFFLAAVAGADVVAAGLVFRAAAQRFLGAADMRRRFVARDRHRPSKPCSPVMSIRTPH